MIDFSNFQVLNLIKRKESYSLLRIENTLLDEIFVAKHFEIHENLLQSLKAYMNEIYLLKKLPNEHILELKGISETKTMDPTTKIYYNSLYFIFENFDKTLKDVLKEKKESKTFFNLEEMTDITKQLISILVLLEENKISHLAIKPSSFTMIGNTFKVKI